MLCNQQIDQTIDLAKHDPGGGLSQAQIGVKTVHVNFVHPPFGFTAVLRFWRGLIITFIVIPYIFFIVVILHV